MPEILFPFGEYKGKPMDKVPSGLLKWVAERFHDGPICFAADEEYQERERNNSHWWN